MQIKCGEIISQKNDNSVRAVMFNNDKIGIMRINKYNSYIFPGGTVEEGESLENALIREVLEETGYEVKVKDHVVTIHYSGHDTNYVNHYFECEVVRNTYNIKHTDIEVDLGLSFEWIDVKELYRFYLDLDEIIVNNDSVQKSSRSRGFLLLTKIFRDKAIYNDLLIEWIGNKVEVIIDRPINYMDKYKNVYKVNYGYIESRFSLDGEYLDAYVIGPKEPVEKFNGKVIGVVRRYDDEEDKLVVALDYMSKEEIMDNINFNEKFFDSKLIVK